MLCKRAGKSRRLRLNTFPVKSLLFHHKNNYGENQYIKRRQEAVLCLFEKGDRELSPSPVPLPMFPFRCSLSDVPCRCPEASHGVFPVHLCYDKSVKTIKNKYLTRAMSRKVHRMRLRKEHFPCPIC